MLSFDVTDRKIRIIKGTESGGKIKISAAAEIALEESVIVNGRVNDTNRVAVMINQVLKRNNMPDKEAIVAISSNQTVFKELLITPNSKESEFMREIRTQLQVQLNIDDSYSVAYVIVGDPENDENGEKKQRVLVTACPYDVIECYKRIFHMLNITLRSVMIGCNAITKVLLADSKIKAKMPLLAVQIDSGFISLNLYENNQLSFSRFASIDPEDYNDPDDYIFEAVNENIFRMLQFARSRGSDNLSNVVFYGDVNASPNLYNRLIDEMSNNDINVSQLNVPPQIHGYQNLEFAVYANSIGAMFKRNKLTEHINLLETENSGAAAGKAKSDKSTTIFALVGLGVSILCVAGAWIGLSVADGVIKADTAKLQADIDSPETKEGLQKYDALLVMRDSVNGYKALITNTADAYKTQPVIEKAYYDAIEKAIAEVQKANKGTEEEAIYSNMTYEDGSFEVPIKLKTTDPYSNKYPAALVDYLYKNNSDLFSDVAYEGYTVGDESGDEDEEPYRAVTFNLVLTINTSKNLPELEEETTEAETDAAAGDTAAAE